MDERGLLDLMIGRIPGISAAERVLLARKFETEADIAILSKRDLESVLMRPLKISPDMGAVRARAEEDALRSRRAGIAYAAYTAPEYPPLLRELPDPPALVFYRGKLPDPAKPLAAVVGTRRPSGPAAVRAYDIARDLARGGISVVSGLALGIDAMAHRGNLEGGGRTVAVLGSGLDEVYPGANRMLARRIVETGGVLLSEYPPGTEPRKWHFPARNRIIAGLARGVLIVEAPRSSGALITAQFALDQGRDLWVAGADGASGSGAVDAGAVPFGEGARLLAEQGGRVIAGAAAILEEWGYLPAETGGTVPFSGAALASSLAVSLNVKM
jgi:DNA processing protein